MPLKESASDVIDCNILTMEEVGGGSTLAVKRAWGVSQD